FMVILLVRFRDAGIVPYRKRSAALERSAVQVADRWREYASQRRSAIEGEVHVQVMHSSEIRAYLQAQYGRLRGVPGDGGYVGAPAPVPHMRSRRVLRRFEEYPRDQALSL